MKSEIISKLIAAIIVFFAIVIIIGSWKLFFNLSYEYAYEPRVKKTIMEMTKQDIHGNLKYENLSEVKK